jgi:hypothetical protein
MRIDVFILSKIESAKLTLAPKADRATFVRQRRLSPATYFALYLSYLCSLCWRAVHHGHAPHGFRQFFTRTIMSDDWDYQLRFKLSDESADAARRHPQNPAYKPIADILVKHGATATSVYDAFVNYVAVAEAEGVEGFPLYKWTKATIEDPEKIAKHKVSFAIHVKGAEVYDKASADALEADLRPLADSGLLVSLTKHDTNPQNNPQAPAHLQ